MRKAKSERRIMDDALEPETGSTGQDRGQDRRLIERWLPIAALSEESVRERRSLQALPPVYYLHVWWARRPLVASRAAVLAAILPENASRDKFLHILGIHGDPVRTRRQIDRAKKTGEDLGLNPYGYERAFKYLPTASDRHWIEEQIGRAPCDVQVLDPTAGGGSIPFEAERLGLAVLSNDLNPVAALVEKATLEYPKKYGTALLGAFQALAAEFIQCATPKFRGVFPAEAADTKVTGYLWARTVSCPYCEGTIPLSPNWKLGPDGTGVRLRPHLAGGPHSAGRKCSFEIVGTIHEHSAGTVSDGDATCIFPDCGRVVDGIEIKRQVQAGAMGEQLFAVVFKRRIETRTKAGNRGREKWERVYRAPRVADDNSAEVTARLAEKLVEWDALNFIPSESVPEGNKTAELIRYGMKRWTDLFNPRQLLGHGIGVEVYRNLLRKYEENGQLSPINAAAFVYLALSLDKMLNWNARISSWNVQLQGMRSVFDRHDFAFKWSYAEMAPVVVGEGYEWVIEQTEKCIRELVELTHANAARGRDLLSDVSKARDESPLTITCKSGDSLDHLSDTSIDVVVMDPPYYDNVMYAELSDFFYVWLKRTAGHVVPELFTRQLTDKDSEAVANPAKFQGEKGASTLAGRDYQERMASIFEECRRVLKPDGIMTLMFTHKATGAWDALTKGLMKAGFTITASWPINTEAEGSLHIKNKSAANSTIFLVCRPRAVPPSNTVVNYWEDVEPSVARAVRARVREFQEAGIMGVDLYLASFGPALEEFSRYWPLKRGTPRPNPESKRRRKQSEMFEDEFDPYAVTPEDALEAARREVKRWRLEQLTHMKANEELDPLTSFFVLAWDAFRAPVFPFDEALRLARAVGVDLDSQVVNVLCEKKGSDLIMWDSGRRAAKGALGPADGRRAMIDAIHHAAHIGRTRTLAAAREMLANAQVESEPSFLAALEAVLEVLPVSKAFSGIELEGDLALAGSDFEALENLRKLAFSKQVDVPKQLELWQAEAVA
jgi:putative DNA methylase